MEINGIYPDYTILYQQVVNDYGQPSALSKIPSVSIDGENFVFSEMFLARYKTREIGAETVEYWMELANRVITEAALIFNAKIKEWQAALPHLASREFVSTETTTDNFYYNPTVVANNAEGLSPKLQSTTEHVFPHHIVYNSASTAGMLNEIMDLRNIYYDCLVYCDKLFMSIY